MYENPPFLHFIGKVVQTRAMWESKIMSKKRGKFFVLVTQQQTIGRGAQQLNEVHL